MSKKVKGYIRLGLTVFIPSAKGWSRLLKKIKGNPGHAPKDVAVAGSPRVAASKTRRAEHPQDTPPHFPPPPEGLWWIGEHTAASPWSLSGDNI